MTAPAAAVLAPVQTIARVGFSGRSFLFGVVVGVGLVLATAAIGVAISVHSDAPPGPDHDPGCSKFRPCREDAPPPSEADGSAIKTP